MLSMLQEDAASSDGRWGYGGQAGGGGHGQQGLTGRDRRASVGSGMKHIGDRTWRQGGNSHGFAGVGEGDEGERGGTQQGPANGGGPAKRRGGDVSSPQTLKKSLFASHEGSGNEKRGSDQIEAGMTGSNTGLDGAGELSPRRASFPGGAGASAEPRDASRSAPEPPRPEDPFVTWERTRTLLANRDPDTVEIITEVFLQPLTSLPSNQALHPSPPPPFLTCRPPPFLYPSTSESRASAPRMVRSRKRRHHRPRHA